MNWTNEQVQTMIEAGFTQREIEQAHKALVYRKRYNAQPHVQQARKIYNKRRYDRMKTILQLAK